MKKLIVLSMLLGACASFAQPRAVVQPGAPVLVRQPPPPPLVQPHPDRLPPPGPVHFRTPFAVNFFGLSFPWAEPLEIYGLRLNLTVPFASAGHDVVYGFDIGLSGETAHDVGGLAVNVFDNCSETFTGVEIALVNAVTELHGLQVGLVNMARGGRGLQIGLWNQSDFLCFPLIGIAR